jgi:hypothetical protein
MQSVPVILAAGASYVHDFADHACTLCYNLMFGCCWLPEVWRRVHSGQSRQGHQGGYISQRAEDPVRGPSVHHALRSHAALARAAQMGR